MSKGPEAGGPGQSLSLGEEAYVSVSGALSEARVPLCPECVPVPSFSEGTVGPTGAGGGPRAQDDAPAHTAIFLGFCFPLAHFSGSVLLTVGGSHAFFRSFGKPSLRPLPTWKCRYKQGLACSPGGSQGNWRLLYQIP